MPSEPPKVIVHEKKRARSDGFLKIDAIEYSFADEGAGAQRRKAEVLERGDSAGVLIHLTEDDTFVLARQFRAPLLQREAEAAAWTVEIVAGVVNDGEAPAQAARREAMEEVGLDVGECEHVATVYPSPGGSSERIFVYYAAVSGNVQMGRGGGLGDERIDTVIATRSELAQMCREGAINDAKTLIAAQWFLLR